ncbi:hypothetical protein A2U01_0048599, partial [Trifolium medium]|nr:hypothetical protein [Trifolium medium]
MSTRRRRGGVNDGAGNSTTSSFTDQLPSDLSQTDRISVEQTTKDPPHLKSHRSSNTEKVKPFTTTESNSAMVEQNTNNKYQTKLHEKLAALQVKTKRMTYDLEKTKEIIDLNNLDTSKVILSDIRAMINAVVSKNDDNSNKQVGIVNDESSLAVKFHGGPCDDEIEEEEE